MNGQDRRSGRRRAYDIFFKTVVYLSAFLTVALLVVLIGYIFVRGLPHITGQLLSTAPSVLKDTIGILPNILNTLYIILFTLLIALPLGVGAAVYLTEYASNKTFIRIVEFATETLAGIPSIIYGLVGMLFFAQMLGFQTSLLSGGCTLVIMILPTIIRTTQESLKTVPQSYREGALGLGATKWYMIRTIILPSSVDGIVTGCILSIGRIVGESAALLFTAGVGTVVANNIFFGLHAQRRHPQRGAVHVCERTRRVRRGLRHRGHPDAPGAVHQRRGEAGGKEAAQKNEVTAKQ